MQFILYILTQVYKFSCIRLLSLKLFQFSYCIVTLSKLIYFNFILFQEINKNIQIKLT